MLEDFRLKVFYTCALRRNFTKAAKELGISQPAVSNHIFELEGIIGDILFIRKRGDITLTEKGKLLFDYTERILNIYNCANRELIPMKMEEKDDFRIGTVPNAVRDLLTPLVEYFKKIYPNIETSVIERSSEELEVMLEENLIDLAITTSQSSKHKTSIFATLSIDGSTKPMRSYYISRKFDSTKNTTIDKFIHCCKVF